MCLFWSSEKARYSAKVHIFHAFNDVQRNLNFQARRSSLQNFGPLTFL